ncbi:hypothetical protein [Flavonifractor plautii]|uniref:hypothetical protein n=1 Tax=Flavonifractor plautii TaxID=292800 RepID=UPI001FAB91C9|nr:hypothetical protein [Flavonifractor plautii]
MAKQKSLEQLRAEKEQVEKRLAQEQHKLERWSGRISFAKRQRDMVCRCLVE